MGVPVANTNIFKFDYEDETLNDNQLSFTVENMMHNRRVNKHYNKGKVNSLHRPFAANIIVPRIIWGHLI